MKKEKIPKPSTLYDQNPQQDYKKFEPKKIKNLKEKSIKKCMKVFRQRVMHRMK